MASQTEDCKTEGSSDDKIIALIDMDAFECQIYKRMYPNEDFYGKPWVVVDQTGRIVSATQEARNLGISRQIRLREAQKIARKKNVALKVFKKPNDREKPDAKEVRYATWDILDSLKEYQQKHSYGIVIEYASCDEFYLDITEEVNLRIADEELLNLIESRTFLETEREKIDGESLKQVLNSRYRFSGDKDLQFERKLVCGGLIMQEVNNFLFRQTKMIASVGVGCNKLMAKLAVSLNKPNGITILPQNALSRVGDDILIEKIPGFGGVFGTSLKEILNISTMNELAKFELNDLQDFFGDEKGFDIYSKCRGYSEEPVKEKWMTEEVSSGKSFFGQITSDETLQYHMHQLIEELLDRLGEELERHKRLPTHIRFSLIYSPKTFGTGESEEEKLSWSFSTVYETCKSCEYFCNEAILAVLNEKSINIEDIKVTRVEVRAKGFVDVQAFPVT